MRSSVREPINGANANSSFAERKDGIQISESQYSNLAELVYRLSGINLGVGKKDLMRARLAKRLRVSGCRDVREYLNRLEKDSTGSELILFLDCITTNKTDFFRESQHFDFLVRDFLPRLDKVCKDGAPLLIWSAACSTGEEPYTLAMVLLENKTSWSRRDAKILASDLSTQVLDHAKRGVYAMERVSDIPRSLLTRYFQRGTKQWEGHARVRPELRSMIQFKRINLMDPFEFQQKFHIIFCRNTMIYFDRETRERLTNKFHECIAPGGYLFVGHSESLTGVNHPFKFIRPAVYRKEG